MEKSTCFILLVMGTDCIGFKHTAEKITWNSLEDILEQININQIMLLILNMTSCFGIHAIKTVNPFSSDKAFYGLIQWKT